MKLNEREVDDLGAMEPAPCRGLRKLAMEELRSYDLTPHELNVLADSRQRGTWTLMPEQLDLLDRLIELHQPRRP